MVGKELHTMVTYQAKKKNSMNKEKKFPAGATVL